MKKRNLVFTLVEDNCITTLKANSLSRAKREANMLINFDHCRRTYPLHIEACEVWISPERGERVPSKPIMAAFCSVAYDGKDEYDYTSSLGPWQMYGMKKKEVVK